MQQLPLKQNNTDISSLLPLRRVVQKIKTILNQATHLRRQPEIACCVEQKLLTTRFKGQEILTLPKPFGTLI
jgi:hypothetical protein